MRGLRASALALVALMAATEADDMHRFPPKAPPKDFAKRQCATIAAQQ